MRRAAIAARVSRLTALDAIGLRLTAEVKILGLRLTADRLRLTVLG